MKSGKKKIKINKIKKNMLEKCFVCFSVSPTFVINVLCRQ